MPVTSAIPWPKCMAVTSNLGLRQFTLTLKYPNDLNNTHANYLFFQPQVRKIIRGRELLFYFFHNVRELFKSANYLKHNAQIIRNYFKIKLIFHRCMNYLNYRAKNVKCHLTTAGNQKCHAGLLSCCHAGLLSCCHSVMLSMSNA